VSRGRTSVASQPQFQIRWNDVERVARDLVTGMTEEEAAQAQRAARPMLVYVYDADDEDAQIAIEEDRAFQADKVAIGARFFACLRIDLESAKADRLMRRYAGKAPCLVFVRPNFEPAGVLRPKFNSNRIFKAMCTAMAKDYENCVETVLKRQKTIQRDRERLQRDKDRIARLDEQIAEAKSRSKAARLTRERQQLARKVDDAETELARSEESLYKLQPRETKTS
jgi:hypothetical protein